MPASRLVVAGAGCLGVLLAAASVPFNTGDRAPHSHGGSPSAAHVEHDAMHGHAAQAAHDHGRVVSLPAGPGAPTLDFTLTRDPVAGWNLHIETTGFRFAPESVNGAHVPGEGHAHVYVNGAKLARVYGPWLHIPGLPAGDSTVTVTLNANDHGTLAVGGEPLSLTRTMHAGR